MLYNEKPKGSSQPMVDNHYYEGGGSETALVENHNGGSDQPQIQTDPPGIEELLQEQGGVKWIQPISLIVIWFQIASGNWMNYQFSFLLKYPVFQCERDGKIIPDGSDEFKTYCKPSYFCEHSDVSWEPLYNDELSLNNWIRDFDLTCESKFAISFFSMSWIIGFLLGFFMLPFFQDNYGRKYVFCIAVFIINILMVVICLLPHHNSSKWVLYCLTFLSGIFATARFTTGYNYATELWPSQHLSTAGTMVHFFEGLVIISVSTFYMTVSKNWQPVMLFGAGTGFIFMIVNLLVFPESPKWLYSRKRYGECSDALAKLAKLNRIENIPLIRSLKFFDNQSHLEPDAMQYTRVQGTTVTSEQQALIDNNNQKKAQKPYMALFTERVNLFNLIAMCSVWTSGSFGYYLISFQTKYLGGDFFINNITSAVSEMLSYLLAGVTFHHLGLKLSIYTSLILSLIGMICLAIIKTNSQLWISIFILLSKFGASQLLTLSYLGNTTLFPIAQLATSFSICNIWSRFVTIFAPFVAEIDPIQVSQWTFIAIQAATMVFSTLIVEGKGGRGNKKGKTKDANQ